MVPDVVKVTRVCAAAELARTSIQAAISVRKIDRMASPNRQAEVPTYTGLIRRTIGPLRFAD
jgi:hypothetical protein